MFGRFLHDGVEREDVFNLHMNRRAKKESVAVTVVANQAEVHIRVRWVRQVIVLAGQGIEFVGANGLDFPGIIHVKISDNRGFRDLSD